MNTYYVTTAIMYPNAKPHIGFAYELVIADFLARWHRLCNDDVFFLTGTDEHGQKLADAAAKANKTPKQFVGEMSRFVKELVEKLNASNNNFIRTTEKKHWKTAADVFTKVFNKGFIYKGRYEGLYCTGCEAFYTEKDLIDGLCPNHKKKPKKVSEESYFFKMSKFQNQLISHIKNNPEFIQPDFRRKEILNRLDEPLRDLSVSRKSLKWGIPVPQDKTHVLYVWFDALLNYFSGVSYPTRKFTKYWPCDCHVIGKDIIWFHTVIWPTILMAAGFELPKKILIHGFLTHDGHKMSKSLGNVVDPFEVLEKYPADSLRYVLMRDVPAGQDGDFSEANLISRHNGDLADCLGNLLRRTSVLIQKQFKGVIPICGKLDKEEELLNKEIPDVKKLQTHIDNCDWNHAIESIWNYIKRCNKYINDTCPWKVENQSRLATILYTLIEHLRIISILVYPLIPDSAEKIAQQINQPVGKLKDVKFKKTTKGFVSESEILFRKLEEPKQKAEPFEKLDLKVGIIEKAEQHPDADKLFVLKINAGDEKRQIVSGMKPFYDAKELEGKHIIFVSNLKPAKFRGVESQGMMLSAEKNNVVKVLESPDSKAGEQVHIEGVQPKPGMIKIDDFAKINLVVKDRNVFYKNKALKTKTGQVVVDMPDGSVVK